MDEVVSKVEAVLEKLKAKIEDLRTEINSALSKVPGFLDSVVGAVKDGWKAFCDKMQEFWVWFADKLAYVGDPGKLNAVSLSWMRDVGGPASQQSQLVDAGELLVDDNWTGDAAEQYRQKLPEQKSALESIRNEFSTVISGALDTLRNGIYVFWVSVMGAIIAMIVGIVGAMASTATIVGLPAAPVIASMAAVTALGALGGGIAILNSTATSANNKMTQAATFGLTTWPSFAVS